MVSSGKAWEHEHRQQGNGLLRSLRKRNGWVSGSGTSVAGFGFEVNEREKNQGIIVVGANGLQSSKLELR
jgi:hypothetical protein